MTTYPMITRVRTYVRVLYELQHSRTLMPKIRIMESKQNTIRRRTGGLRALPYSATIIKSFHGSCFTSNSSSFYLFLFLSICLFCTSITTFLWTLLHLSLHLPPPFFFYLFCYISLYLLLYHFLRFLITTSYTFHSHLMISCISSHHPSSFPLPYSVLFFSFLLSSPFLFFTFSVCTVGVLADWSHLVVWSPMTSWQTGISARSGAKHHSISHLLPLSSQM